MTDNNDKTPHKDDLKLTEDSDFSSRPNDLEKTKATLKASMPNPDKAGRNLVNSDEQELFCKLRADGRNLTDAARIAYPNDKYPSQRGSELGQMPHIRARIEMLKSERAYAAKLVDPQESLIRWNEIYNSAMDSGDIKIAIEAQKQIDKINGAETYQVTEKVKGVFRGEDEEEWHKSSNNLLNILGQESIPTKKDIN